MYKSLPRWRTCLSVVFSLFLLYSFYLAGVSASVLPVLGAFFILIILLRGPLYRKIDAGITRKFSFFEKLPSWGKKISVIMIFFLLFAALKQTVFYSLKLVGVDLQEIMTESVYRSVGREESGNEKCAWEITEADLEKLGLHCSQIAGYYYGPALVGVPSDKYECNPVPGCQYDPSIVPFETEEECGAACGTGVSEELIKDYLEENIGIAGFGGKTFCAYEVLGEERNGAKINEYLWVLCQEYYQENGNLRQGTGISLPVALAVGEQGQIVSHRMPGNGSHYEPDVREIFPEEYHIKIFPQAPDYLEYNERAKRLSEETQKEAEDCLEEI